MGHLQAESPGTGLEASGLRGWVSPLGEAGLRGWPAQSSVLPRCPWQPIAACCWLHMLLSTAVKGQWGEQLLRWPFWVPLYCWVALIMSVEASWSQGEKSASTGWPPPYICEEETHTWGRRTLPSSLSYYLGACHSEAETHSFPMKISTPNSDHETCSREDHL